MPGMSAFITLISSFAPPTCERGVVHRHHSSQGVAKEDFSRRLAILSRGVPEFKHGARELFQVETARCAALLHQALDALDGSLRMPIRLGIVR